MEDSVKTPASRYRSRGKNTSAIPQPLLYAVSAIALLLLGLVVFQQQKLGSVKSALQSKKNEVELQKEELDVLRAINPYQYAFEQVIPRAVNDGNIFPGWVTRVFPAPRVPGQALTMMDMGAFILDQKKFNLAVHRSYGLETTQNVLYKMNGLLPSKKPGRYQIGIEFSYDNSLSGQDIPSTKIYSCFARLDVNTKRVIDTNVRFQANRSFEKLITGDISVVVGVHPISASIYCDGDGRIDTRSVQVSMRFREPGQVFLQQNGHAVFHIYKPNDA